MYKQKSKNRKNKTDQTEMQNERFATIFYEIYNNYGESNRMYLENCLDLRKTHIVIY